MSRRRYISTDISTDNRIAKLADSAGDFAALLYTWMVPHAADDCSIIADPDELLMLVVPGFRKKKVQHIEAALAAMVEFGLLTLEGDRYIFPPKAFYKYQTYIKDGNRRAPNCDEQRKTPQNIEERGETEKSAENAVSPSPSPSPSLSLSPTTTTKGPSSGQEIKATLEARPNTYKLYDQLFGVGRLNDFIRKELDEIEDGWEGECIEHCFREGAVSNARSLKLVRSILDDHKQRGCYAGKPMARNGTHVNGLTESDRAQLASLGVGAKREVILD